MNDAGLFISPKWELMQELATTSQSPTMLAKKLHTSIPNVLHHLKLLEAHGIIASSTKRTRTSGKPPTLYGLARPLAFITLLDEIGGMKKTINPGIKDKFIIRTMVDFREGWSHALTKIAIENPDLLTEDTAMSLINRKDHTADLLLITPTIEEFRTKRNKLKAEINRKEYTLTVWSHTREEFEEGLNNKETYFMKYLKSELIHDPKKFLKRVLHENS